ncbi:MAG: glycosyltransferase [Candidatus Eisenbacteria bacterium]|uniref:Glycosyltransferase n=1 Tax=Eiseniibacteriota bacterium TaxID=2212470 RepID=A0A948W2V6_UNCEI|nr:glycosyltransferase [Candidatus Eisenbacteria bacterium]MBU1947640.1 glycosyltransferase [Candidatus Eisenbacteria bacterium]MBU2690397.1 glycosyltransferase [Candidatus Eisenbacteria bacterium]
MKICHIVKDLETCAAAERVVKTCEELHGRGHEIVLVAGGDRDADSALWARARSGGYRLFRMKELSGGAHPFRGIWAGVLLVRLLAQLQPEMIHTHGHQAGLLGNRVVKRLPDPILVHSLLGSELKQDRSLFGRWRYRRWERECIRRADATVCAGKDCAAASFKIGVVENKSLHPAESTEELESLYRSLLPDLGEEPPADTIAT